MVQIAKAKVFTSGGSQVVVNSGRVPLLHWNEIFAGLDKTGVPDDFKSHRDQASLQESDEP
jgi:hypothetical protein